MHTLTCILSWIHTHSAVYKTSFYMSIVISNSFAQTSSTGHLPRDRPPYLLLCERLGPGLPSCWGRIPVGLHFSSFPQFLPHCWSTMSIKLPFFTPLFTALASSSEAQSLPGPRWELPDLLWLLLPQPCPLSHFSTCSETYTYMWTRCASLLQTL